MISNNQLQDMANILRRDVLISTSKAGSGHPTTCMSCAEIMSTLFFEVMSYDVKNAFNPDNDEFILSKGHAAPILYSVLYRSKAIKDNLMSLRKLKSPLEGHPMPRSLKWVKVATGSLGQGLSVGVGMALAAKLQKRKFYTYVLLGDSEIAEGSVYEAMELASHYNLDNLIAIIDINRLGQRGETMIGHNIKDYEKRFNGFGWKTITINGHNISKIVEALTKARRHKKPVAILAKTMKGKGVSFLENKEGWHGKTLKENELKKALNEIPNPSILEVKIKSPEKIGRRKQVKKKLKLVKYKAYEEIATREAYGDALAALAKSSINIISVDGEVSNSTFAEKLKKVRPKQFIEAYIAEQNMVGMALGLSIKGFNVFTSTFAAFLSRAHDQIRMAALSSPKNLTFCGSHAGVSIGEDGPSQMGLEDISIFRDLPNSIIFYPSDAVSTKKLTVLASKLKGIKYIRTTRSKTQTLYENNEKFSVGNFKILEKASKDKAVIVGSGITVRESLKAHKKLKQKNISTAVIDLYCIKPFNIKKFISFVKKHGNKVVVSEDHYLEGGIGEMLSEGLINSGIKMKSLAIREIPHSGKEKELLDKYGISSKSIVKAVKSLI